MKSMRSVIFNREGQQVAWLALAAAFLVPNGNVGFSLCAFHGASGLPCPGCGMLRSLCSIGDGRWVDAVRFHPFGLLVFGFFLGLALLTLVPAAVGDRVAAWVDRRDVALRRGLGAFLALFLAFGVVRALSVLALRLADAPVALQSGGHDLSWLISPFLAASLN